MLFPVLHYGRMILCFLMKARDMKLTLRLFNDALTIIVIVLALYIIVTPFLPQATFWVREKSPVRGLASKRDDVARQADSGVTGNMLFIPALGLSEQIHEGSAEKLKHGVLHRSHTSTPDHSGNTVFVGHRFMYYVRGVFYHLDKVNEGDDILIHWNGKKYAYRVVETFVVPADRVSIEQQTDKAVLTLYTCTPLWSAKDRLVVRALLIEERL